MILSRRVVPKKMMKNGPREKGVTSTSRSSAILTSGILFLAGLIFLSGNAILPTSPAGASAHVRRLDAEGDQEAPFLPRLEYTGPGAWEDSPNADLAAGEPTGGDVTIKMFSNDDHSASGASFRQGDKITFVIYGFGKTNIDRGLIVWFESLETNVVFSAPALPQPNGDLVAKASFVDPGQYKVHVVGYDRTKVKEGARGTVATVLPVRKSPWRFDVIPERMDPQDAPVSVPTDIDLPTRICESSDLEMNGNGRWVECASAGIHPSQCLADGWVYVPHDCKHVITNTVSALEQSKAIAQMRGGKPVWIVVSGSSIERGTYHALVDILGSIGMLEGGVVQRSVSDAIFGSLKDIPGQGSTTKCWGWIDIQIGSVRLSYQDARSVYQYEDPNSEWAIQTSKRWHEILSEKPDLFVVPIYSNGSLEYSQVVQAAADTNYEGLVAFSPQKKHILGGGISVTYSKETALSAPERAVETLSNVFHDCSDCDHLDRRHFFVSDEMTMAWALLNDMERPMSSTVAAQHFHTYLSEATSRPQCGTKHSDRHYVTGSVTEMSAQMYLGTVLSHLNGVFQLDNPIISDNLDPFCDESFDEVELARQHPFRSCFTCPNTIKPGKSPWQPPSSPEATLSVSPLANEIQDFRTIGDLVGKDIAFCYETPGIQES